MAEVTIIKQSHADPDIFAVGSVSDVLSIGYGYTMLTFMIVTVMEVSDSGIHA